MQKVLLALFVAILTLSSLPFQAYAAPKCRYSVGKQMTTPSYHCKKNCKDWDKKVPWHSLCVETKRKNAYLSSPKYHTSNGGWFKASAFVQSNEGKKICFRFKNWTHPVVVSLSAKVCF